MKNYYVLSSRFHSVEIVTAEDPADAISRLDLSTNMAERVYYYHYDAGWEMPYRPVMTAYNNGSYTAPGYWVIEIPGSWVQSISPNATANDIKTLVRAIKNELRPDVFAELLDVRTEIVVTVYQDDIRSQMDDLAKIQSFNVDTALKMFRVKFASLKHERTRFECYTGASDDGRLFRAIGSNIDAICIRTIDRALKFAVAQAAAEASAATKTVAA